MKLFKFRKTNSNLKRVLTLLLNLAVLSGASAQEKEVKQTKATTKQQSTQTVITPPNNRTTTQAGRVPAAVPTDTRDFVLAPEDAAAIEAEEAARLKSEADIAKDEAKSAIIKRTFGSSIFATTKFDFAQAVNVGTPNNYVLGPGDKLNVNIYGYSENEQEVTVNADGFVVLKKGGLVYVAGLNMESAESKIRAALSKTYPRITQNGDTFVRVTLSGFKTIKVKITGQVIAPGTYTVTTFTTFMTALYACGGPNEIGTYRDISLIRGNKVIAKLDIYDYQVNGFSSSDVLLKDQDIIHVGPFKSRVAVNGETKITGLFETLPSETLEDLLKYAGGFNQYAYSDLVKLYRYSDGERKILNVNRGGLANEKVFMGDSVVVERVLDRFQNMITIEGAVFRPGEYSLDSNPTLSKLIKSAAGLKEESLQGRVNIYRTNNDLTISNISVNLLDIEDGKVSDLTLRRLDRIVVPSIFDLTEKATIKIQGAINNPDGKEGVELPFVKDLTIQDVIVSVGGLTEAASLSRIEIVRRKRNIDPKQSDAQIAEIITFNMRPDLTLVESYESNILLPFDEIIVRNSPNYEKQNLVKISGEVLYPGTYGIEYKDERISKLISRAGGLTDLAFLKGATLLRRTLLSERQRVKREETLGNLNMNNKVKEAAGLDDITLDPAVPLTTTTTTAGEEADSFIDEEIGLDFVKILANPNDPTYDMILQAGDEIVIPKRLETVRIEGEVLYPTSVKFQSGKGFLSYISEAGGYTKKSAKGSAFVRYPNGSVDRTRKFLFVRFHPKVEPGSEIMIPRKMETTAEQFTQFSGLIATVSGTLATIVTIIGLVRLNR